MLGPPAVSTLMNLATALGVFNDVAIIAVAFTLMLVRSSDIQVTRNVRWTYLRRMKGEIVVATIALPRSFSLLTKCC